MQRAYKNNVIDGLRRQQSRYAPRDKRLEQIEAAERLIAEVDPDKKYPYEYVCFRITGIRPETDASEKIAGDDLRHDLRLLVEDLSDSADLQADAIGEPVLTVDELANQFNVSTKTISRWRELGLVSRRLVFDGRKRVGFLRSSVDRFVRNNQDRVERGARFSQLTDEQRVELLDQARRMAGEGHCQAEVARKLADRSGRSVETIRAALRQFDKENRDLAIFPDLTGPLTEAQKQKIYRDFRRGVSVERLMKRYTRTKTTIYRVDWRNPRRANHGTPVGLYPQRPFLAQGRRQRLPWPHARKRRTAKESPSAKRPTAVFGEFVRNAAADARAGSALVPQVQLLEVQGVETSRPA